MEVSKCGLLFPPNLHIDWATYNKAKRLYSKRREFKPIKPDIHALTLIYQNLPAYKLLDAKPWNYKWYQYKNRVFVYKPFCRIAIFVISNNKIYSPLIACGAIYSDIYSRIFKTPLFLKLLTIPYVREWH